MGIGTTAEDISLADALTTSNGLTPMNGLPPPLPRDETSSSLPSVGNAQAAMDAETKILLDGLRNPYWHTLSNWVNKGRNLIANTAMQVSAELRTRKRSTFFRQVSDVLGQWTSGISNMFRRARLRIRSGHSPSMNSSVLDTCHEYRSVSGMSGQYFLRSPQEADHVSLKCLHKEIGLLLAAIEKGSPLTNPSVPVPIRNEPVLMVEAGRAIGVVLTERPVSTSSSASEAITVFRPMDGPDLTTTDG